MSLRPPLTSLEAAINVAQLQERDTARYFGVYKGRRFVAIRYATPYLLRLIWYVRWLVGSISYKKEDVERLAALSKSKWVPAQEKDALQVKVDEKGQQLAQVLARLTQAEQVIAMKTRDMREAEQVNDIRVQALRDKQATLDLVENARVTYERLHHALQGELQQATAAGQARQQAYLKLEREKQTVDGENKELSLAVTALARQREQLLQRTRTANVERSTKRALFPQTNAAQAAAPAAGAHPADDLLRAHGAPFRAATVTPPRDTRK